MDFGNGTDGEMPKHRQQHQYDDDSQANVLMNSNKNELISVSPYLP
jgi:hypothetical protein